MNKRFLDIYNDELGYLRKTGTLFSEAYPGVAGRLGTIEGDALCNDPFVERLLEGFAFLSARVQHKLESDFPVFTQSILETVNPYILRPLPSASVVKFYPDFSDDGLESGFRVKKDTPLYSEYAGNLSTRCEYRTTKDVNLWPFEVGSASYVGREMSMLKLPDIKYVSKAKSAIKIRLDMGINAMFNSLDVKDIPFFLSGSSISMCLFEMLLTDCIGVLVRDCNDPGTENNFVQSSSIVPIGFDESEKLLPYDNRTFSGYRLMQEYFTLPEKFMFINVTGISDALKHCLTSSIEVVFLLKRPWEIPENSVSKDNFLLYCTTAVNLFTKNIGRVPVSDGESKLHIIVDKMKPLDYEVYDLAEVKGYKESSMEPVDFVPFSFSKSRDMASVNRYYSLTREPYQFSSKRKNFSKHYDYNGSEVYIYLIDSESRPYHNDLKQIGIKVMCTNRDLPFCIKSAGGVLKFSTSTVCPSTKIENVSSVSLPVDSSVGGKAPWLMINFMTLNYLLFNDTDSGKAVESIKELLSLYSVCAGNRYAKHIDGIHSLNLSNVVRRFVIENKPIFLRGIHIDIEFDDNAFAGTGFFLLGMVLSKFFSNYVSLNSFVETTIKSKERGNIIQCPTTIGTRTVV